MSTEFRVAEHLEDEELARLLDDEVSGDERSTWHAHLEVCTDCAHQLDEITDASAWLSANLCVLDAVDAPDDLTRARALTEVRTANRDAVAAQSSQRAYLKAAAILVILAGTLSVPPVRAWITDGVQRLAGSFTTTPVVDAPVAVVEAPGALVTFRPTNSLFLIDLGSAQTAGTITIEAGEGEQATVQVMGGNEEMLLVLSAGLRIENEPMSSASYRIRLPAGSVQRVEIRAAGELIATQPFGNQAAISIDLATSGRTE